MKRDPADVKRDLEDIVEDDNVDQLMTWLETDFQTAVRQFKSAGSALKESTPVEAVKEPVKPPQSIPTPPPKQVKPVPPPENKPDKPPKPSNEPPRPKITSEAMQQEGAKERIQPEIIENSSNVWCSNIRSMKRVAFRRENQKLIAKMMLMIKKLFLIELSPRKEPKIQMETSDQYPTNRIILRGSISRGT